MTSRSSTSTGRSSTRCLSTSARGTCSWSAAACGPSARISSAARPGAPEGACPFVCRQYGFFALDFENSARSFLFSHFPAQMTRQFLAEFSAANQQTQFFRCEFVTNSFEGFEQNFFARRNFAAFHPPNPVFTRQVVVNVVTNSLQIRTTKSQRKRNGIFPPAVRSLNHTCPTQLLLNFSSGNSFRISLVLAHLKSWTYV